MYQIQLVPGGPWHRRIKGNGNDHTACGKFIVGAYASRDIDLEGNVCPSCFTDHEVETGKMKRIQRESEANRLEPYFEEDDDPTDPF